MIRLQKLLASAGLCSRRHAEDHIKMGLVRVNNQLITRMGVKIDPDRDIITFKGQIVKTATKKLYIMLNKPPGYITSCHQPGRKLVTDMVKIPGMRIFPVGRLDKDSCGLLLLTNDGKLHQRLAHPSFNHEKEYQVMVKEPISNQTLEVLRCGVQLKDGITRKAGVKRISSRKFCIILKEGRNRQIRRMTAAMGSHVIHLRRIRVAELWLGELKQGSWRYLTTKEEAKFWL